MLYPWGSLTRRSVVQQTLGRQGLFFTSEKKVPRPTYPGLPGAFHPPRTGGPMSTPTKTQVVDSLYQELKD